MLRKKHITVMLHLELLIGLFVVMNSLADTPVSDTVYKVPPLPADSPLVWDLNRLAKPPKTYAVEGELATSSTDRIRSIFIEGEPFRDKPTRIFCWYGVPATPQGKAPGIVLVHGAGGTAFRDWVQTWLDRGYATIAMDTSGGTPRRQGKRRHAHSGPRGWGRFETIDEPLEDQWSYHAVASVVRAHSLLRSLPGVDANRIGITGISWGGYLTNIVAGIDDRLRFAVPVYGCGFLGENSSWLPKLRKLGEQRAKRWLELWDPSRYVGRSRIPMLYVNGTNDKHYRMDSWQKTYRLPQGEVSLCCKVRMRHAHPPIGDPPEITAFANSIVTGTPTLPKVTGQGRDGTLAWMTYGGEVKLTKAVLNVTSDTGNWVTRRWRTIPATIDSTSHRVSAKLPAKTCVYFFNLIDEHNLIISSPHREIGE